MYTKARFIWIWLVIASMWAQPGLLLAQDNITTPAAQPVATATAAVVNAQVDALLAQMSPADRVGQLFMITFAGDATDFESDIVELVHGYRVGGVIISARNGNFANGKGTDTPRAVATLANQLQGIAYGLLLEPEQALDPMPIAPWPPRGLTYLPAETGVQPSNLPLFIGVDQAGDDLPGTALRRGFTALPSQMAVGATWNPTLATEVGEVVGRELAAVGVNLLLGPNLDVFDQAAIDQVGGLGVFSFGGDPYWVSQLGRAYIAGVHAGGDGRVATVARHFPGQGSADRLPDEEVATIQKNLDELRRVALPPFVSVTRQPSTILGPEGDPSATDLLMTSHMRYSGIQGAGGRGAPLSLSPELSAFVAREGFGPWRTAGGILMSSALGTPAVRRFYGAAAQDFFHRRAALDAFLAGNDLINLASFGQNDQWESDKANIKAVIGFFQDRYNNDADFASRVDAAVRRILQLKLALYRSDIADSSPVAAAASGGLLIPLSKVMVNESDLRVLSGESRARADVSMADVARNGVTILFPDPATQTEPLPPTFRADDDILIFSDSRLVRECAECTAEAAIGPDEVGNIIKRLYGAEATGQIDPDRVTSLTFVDLNIFLDSQRKAALERGQENRGPITPSVSISPTVAITLPAMLTTFDLESFVSDVPTALFQDRNAKTRELIENADWILFAMLDVNPDRYPNSDAVIRFLSEYGDQLSDQKLVVMALNAPYFLDATAMSQLSTYLGVYSKTQPFLESAVRALFGAFTPVGAPPVSVPGTRFDDLASRVEPDPARSLPLMVTRTDGQIVAQNAAAGAIDLAAPSVGVDMGETLRLQVGPVLDRNGHLVPDGAAVGFQLGYEGEDLALAVAPALTSNGVAAREIVADRAGPLRIVASAGEATSGLPVLVTVAPPPTPTAGPADALTAAAPAVVAGAKEGKRSSLLALLLALATLLVTLSLFLIVQIRILPRPTLVHNLLWAAIFGLLGYVLYGLGFFPGGQWLQASIGVLSVPLVVFVPMLLPLLWLQLRSELR